MGSSATGSSSWTRRTGAACGRVDSENPQSTLSLRSYGTCHGGSSQWTRLLHWFNPEHRPVVLIGEHIEEPVRALTYVPNALMELHQQRLAAQLSKRLVEDDALEAARSWHFAAPRAADEQIAAPGWKAVTGVERQSRWRNRRQPHDSRCL